MGGCWEHWLEAFRGEVVSTVSGNFSRGKIETKTAGCESQVHLKVKNTWKQGADRRLTFVKLPAVRQNETGCCQNKSTDQ